MGESEVEALAVGTMFVVEPACKFAPDQSSATITIESSNDENFPAAIDELSSMDARNLALRYAAIKGVPDPRINGNMIGPYAVNTKGVSLEDVDQELPPQAPEKTVGSYRVDVPVCRKLV